MIEPVLLTLVGATIIAGAVYDAATLTIPNWISLVLIALFPALAYSAGLSWPEAGVHVVVGFAALAAGIGLFAAGLIGGGDAKLFAAISLYVGAAKFGAFIFAVAVAGGVLAFVLLALRYCSVFFSAPTERFEQTTARGEETSTGAAIAAALAQLDRFKHLAARGAGIPYGIAIAAGGLIVLPATRFFMASPY
jgi:prepilin peptidase CpaA